MQLIQNENKSLFSRPRYNNDIAIWLRDFEWTHLLTLSQKLESFLFPIDESSFVEIVRTFFFRMDEKVYGKGQRASTIKHATFFENKTKAGSPTHWHTHSLISIEPRFAFKFCHEAKQQLTRLQYSGIIQFDQICDNLGGINGAASYCAKYEHDNTLMFANMEGVRKHNILPFI